MQNINPADIYDKQIEELNAVEKKLQKRKRLLAWLRFLSLSVSFIALWQLWQVGIAIAFVIFFVFLGSFLFFVVKDLKNKDEIENTRLLIQINKQEIGILKHHFSDMPDGLQLKPEHHVYANDLDLFGKASIYQYINRTTSEQGNQILADWLLNPSAPEIILQRQEAAKELSSLVEWRHQLRAHGITNPVTSTGGKKIETWLKSKNKFINYRFWTITQLKDLHGHIWVSNGDVLSKLKNQNGEFIHYYSNVKNYNDDRQRFILSITQDREGFIW